MTKRYVKFTKECGLFSLTVNKQYELRERNWITNDNGNDIYIANIGCNCSHLGFTQPWVECEKHTRPRITQEANEILDKIKNDTCSKSKSEGIVKYFNLSEGWSQAYSDLKMKYDRLFSSSCDRSGQLEAMCAESKIREKVLSFWRSSSIVMYVVALAEFCFIAYSAFN